LTLDSDAEDEAAHRCPAFDSGQRRGDRAALSSSIF
jgi:hypothetical protein